MSEAAPVRALKPEDGLTQRAYREIHGAILDKRLAPGSLTSVRALSDALGISRTPVREALVELANDRLVSFVRNRGVRIVATQRHDIEEIFELRLLIEVPSVRTAMARGGAELLPPLRAVLADMRASLADETTFMHHDWLFHKVLLAATGNERLVTFVETLRNQTRLRGISTVGRSRALAAIVAEHERILAAVEAGDAEAAVEAMTRHLSVTRDLLLAQEPPDSDNPSPSPTEEPT